MQRIPLRILGIDGRPGETSVLQGFETTLPARSDFPIRFFASPNPPCFLSFPTRTQQTHSHNSQNKLMHRGRYSRAGRHSSVTHSQSNSRTFCPPVASPLDAQALLPLDHEHQVLPPPVPSPVFPPPRVHHHRHHSSARHMCPLRVSHKTVRDNRCRTTTSVLGTLCLKSQMLLYTKSERGPGGQRAGTELPDPWGRSHGVLVAGLAL
jgi:hypothetical protein